MWQTAYELCISDWSSDVCSSDLHMDDNLMEVSPDQGADKVAFYQHPARLRALRVQLEQASLAYFSTEALRDRMVELGVTMNSYVGPICAAVDRKSVERGKSVSVTLNLGGGRLLKKKKKNK